MKIITKKSVIFAALAIVLLATALVISCNAPLDGISYKDGISDKEEPSKPGTGKVLLSINPRNASRTVVPTALPGNTKYLLVLLGDTGTDDFYKTVSTGTNVVVSDVPVGDYLSAQVIVYASSTTLDNETGSTNGSGYATYAIGESSVYNNGSAGFTVNGSPVSLGTHTTALYEPGAKTGNGNFIYKLNKSSRVDSGTFKIVRRGGSAVGGDRPVTFDTEQPAIPLQSGAYNVIYTITDTYSSPFKAYFYEIVYIYQGMDSVFTRTLDDDIFPGLPGTGSGTITISVPGLPFNTLTATVTGTAGATVTANNSGWLAEISKSATAAKIIFTVNNPASGITRGDWVMMPDVDPIPSVVTGGVSNGITFSDDLLSQEFTIVINATENEDPLFDITETDGYAIILEIIYNSKTYNISSKMIHIIFVD